MNRYFNSFFIALCFYAFFAIGIFYIFANDKIIVNKTEVPKTLSLNHVELKPELKPLQEEIKKEDTKAEEPKVEEKKELIEKVVETPKPSIKKKVEKKEEPKKESETTKKVEEIISKTTEKIITAEKEILTKPIVDEKKDYLDKHLAQIRNLINQNVKYPMKARKLSIEGIVVVKFKILEDGSVENIEIIDGHKFLQNATIEAIQEASKNFPKTNKSIEIQIPIEYKLI
ncbi:MAG: energy transducer TonB [Aliarcobacter sp.]|nr:energy transducer TonB [Aliarcobacter sp.]MDD2887692.1 energy transducer TonB [Aliarcobacter sp.]